MLTDCYWVTTALDSAPLLLAVRLKKVKTLHKIKYSIRVGYKTWAVTYNNISKKLDKQVGRGKIRYVTIPCSRAPSSSSPGSAGGLVFITADRSM